MSNDHMRMNIFHININSQDDPQTVANILNLLCSMVEGPRTNTDWEHMFSEIFGPEQAEHISNKINSLMDNPCLNEDDLEQQMCDPSMLALAESMHLDLVDTQVVGEHQPEAYKWILDAYHKYA